MSKTARKDEAVQVRRKSIGIPVWLQAVGWIVRRIGRLIWLIIANPIVGIPTLFLLALVAVGLRWGETIMMIVGSTTIALVVAGMIIWQRRWPESFARRVAGPMRGHARRLAVYRRWWNVAMAEAKLSRSGGDRDLLPKLGRVESSKYTDRIRVKVLRGQEMADWSMQATRLAQAFDVESVRIRTVWKKTRRRGMVRKKQLLELVSVRRDWLAEGVPPIEHPLDDALNHADNVDLEALPMAWTEDGGLFRLRLIGSHVLVVGATGAGKGSFISNLEKALGPAIRSGRVRLLGIDPKGGVELGFAEPLFHELVCGTLADETKDPNAAKTNDPTLIQFADALERWGRMMDGRLVTMRGQRRVHVPTAGDPLYVIIIDEIADLTSGVADRPLKTRLDSALAQLLRKGRAPGFSLVGCVQDPRKDTIPQRGYFTYRIGMRLNERGDTVMVLGEDAIERGALCHRIPRTMQGTAYAMTDEMPEATRLRFPWISDDDLRDLSHMYAPQGAAPELQVVA